MTNKTIYIVSDSFSLEDNNELLNKNNMSITNILIKDDESSAKALLSASKEADLIVIINYNFVPISETIKVVKDIITPINRDICFVIQLDEIDTATLPSM